LNLETNKFQPKDLASWVDLRQAQGLYFFNRKEAIHALQFSEEAFKKAAARLAYKNRIIRIRSDFFIIVPLEYRTTGVIPADWFINDLMAYLQKPYYVGLLSAAFFYGAAHQQPQEFQVVTKTPERTIKKKGLAVRFFFKGGFDAAFINPVKVQTGQILVSSPEATAIDLIHYAKSIGGLDRVLTVFQELGEEMEPGKIIAFVQKERNLPCIQRMGWLMEKAGHSQKVKDLSEWVRERQPPFTRLEPASTIFKAVQDNRWRLFINTQVEGDL